jgi:putative endonuclease
MAASRTSARSRGQRAERRARLHYRLRGYRVLDANAWAGRYELDLVLRRGRRLVFCEVKAKGGDRFGDPVEMITPEKLRRLRSAADLWLVRHPECARLELRYEAVAISPAGLRRIPLT